MAHALDRHLALVGFMGAGKSTLGAQVAERLGRRFVDLDRELERSLRHDDPAALRRARRGGRSASSRRRSRVEALAGERPAVVALGGGAVAIRAIRARARASTRSPCYVDVDPDDAWERVARRRPAARAGRGELPRAATSARAPLYAEAADAVAGDVDDVVLAAAGDRRRARGCSRGSAELVAGRRCDALVATHVDRHPRAARAARRSAGARVARAAAAARRRRASARSSGSGASCGSTATGRSSRSAAAARPTRRASRPRRTCAASRWVAGADDARRPGRRGDRRQDGGQPARGQEPRRRVPLAGADGRSTRRCSRRCPRASGAPGWPRS